MKRHEERDTASISKRFRGDYVEYSDRESDRMSAEYYRSERGSTKVSASVNSYRDPTRSSVRDRDFSSSYDREFDRSQKRYKDERPSYDDYAYAAQVSRSDRAGSAGQTGEYRTLCLSNLNPRIPDNTIKQAINQEFKKLGDFNIKIVHAGEHRIAYVNFRYPEDARDAKYARANKLFLFDMPTRIDAVFPKKLRGDSPEIPSSTYGREVYASKSVSPQGQSRSTSTRQEVSSETRDREYSNRSYDNRTQQDGSKHHEHKFPHHLHHIQPEDDDKATRTLFVGNLDIATVDEDLRNVFERYGVVEDIDIKRPGKGQGNAYAFVKFGNLDMAHRAKVDMSGRYIGKLQCKIGYGKVNPTNCVWIGGLGPWINPNSLEAEFDRFGVIHKVQWTEGKNYAFLLFESQDAAQAACKEMRGYPLGGQDRRLRVDFADPAVIGASVPAERPEHRPQLSEQPEISKHSTQDSTWQSKSYNYNSRNKGERSTTDRPEEYRNPEPSNTREADYNYKPRREDIDNVSELSDRWKHSKTRHDDSGYRTRQSPDYPRGYTPPARDRDGRTSPASKRQKFSSSEDQFYDRSYYGKEHSSSNGNYGGRTQASENLFDSELLGSVQSVQDMAKSLPVVWSGALVLKTSAFSTRMHLVSGNVRLVDTLMRDHTTTEMSFLKITQRLRLDQPKLEDMGRRVASSGPHGYSILLAMPGSESALEDANAKTQHRPLKNLVSYLKQKEAAGVISLPPTAGKDQELGVLHAFPPCHFGQEYLQRRAPKLGLEPLKEDHLVVIVVGGSSN